MPRMYKRTFRMYSIQNYQKEIEDLNAASDQGWQLVKGGFFGILAAVLAILAFSGPTLPKILLFLLYVILSVLRLWRWYIQKKPNSKRNGRGDSRVLFVIIGISLLVILASIRMTEMRPRVQQQLWSVPLGPHIAEVHDDRWVEFEVYYTDYYYLELTIDADYPVTLKILNEAGESICSISEKSVQKEIPLRLSKGMYCISVSYFPRCKMTVRIS